MGGYNKIFWLQVFVLLVLPVCAKRKVGPVQPFDVDAWRIRTKWPEGYKKAPMLYVPCVTWCVPLDHRIKACPDDWEYHARRWCSRKAC